MLRLGAVTVDRWRIGVGVGGSEPVTTRTAICHVLLCRSPPTDRVVAARSVVTGEVERLIRESVMTAA
jgi:hypothetical protein